MIKKCLLIIVIMMTALSSVFANIGVTADDSLSADSEQKELKIGDYITLGKYQGEDILWRYVADDENGKLIWSADAVCEKEFDRVFKGYGEYEGYKYETYDADHDWNTSAIREWLRSEDITNGFFNSENFRESEKNAIKSVTIKSIVDNLSFEAKDKLNNYYYRELSVADEKLQKEFQSYPTEELSENIFLLDCFQLAEIEKNKAILYTDEEFKKIKGFWLRTPFIGIRWGQGGTTYGWNDVFYGLITTDAESKTESFMIWTDDPRSVRQVRPAFYLNEETARILSGSGTKFDPYEIDTRSIPERFEENGLYGYRDENGVIIEAKYEKALPFSCGAALIVQPGDDKWSYIDYDGNLLFEKSFYASNNFINGYALILANDKPQYAYIKKNGEIAYDMLFDDAEDFKDGYAKVKSGGKWGVIDADFALVVPFEYDNKDDMDLEKTVSDLK